MLHPVLVPAFRGGCVSFCDGVQTGHEVNVPWHRGLALGLGVIAAHGQAGGYPAVRGRAWPLHASRASRAGVDSGGQNMKQAPQADDASGGKPAGMAHATYKSGVHQCRLQCFGLTESLCRAVRIPFNSFMD